jgi:hypothetical protein
VKADVYGEGSSGASLAPVGTDISSLAADVNFCRLAVNVIAASDFPYSEASRGSEFAEVGLKIFQTIVFVRKEAMVGRRVG